MEEKYLGNDLVMNNSESQGRKFLISLFIIASGILIIFLDKKSIGVFFSALIFIGLLLNSLLTKRTLRKYLYGAGASLVYIAIIFFYSVDIEIWAKIAFFIPVLYMLIYKEFCVPIIVGIALGLAFRIIYSGPSGIIGLSFGIILLSILASLIRLSLSKIIANQVKFTQMGRRDSLTNLYNSDYILKAGKRMLTNKATLMVIVLDIDNFKEINDTYGYLAGNSILIQLACQLRQNLNGLRAEIGRLGGDEFIVLLDNYRPAEAEKIHKKLDSQLNKFQYSADPKLNKTVISISSGAAFHDCKEEKEIDEIVNSAKLKKYYKKYENNKLNYMEDEIIESLDPNIQQYIQVLKEKDMYTYVHSVKTAIFARHIARSLNADKKFIDDIYIGGLLHDIGKILVSSTILRKPRNISDQEYKTIKKHVLCALNILNQEKLPQVTINAIKYHHERWDKKGYPNAKSGEEIPLEGRILAVADAYTAMTIKRVYRKVLSHDEAMLEIQKNRGTQFDPNIVDLVIDQWMLEKQA